jgi:hypothetical protein
MVSAPACVNQWRSIMEHRIHSIYPISSSEESCEACTIKNNKKLRTIYMCVGKVQYHCVCECNTFVLVLGTTIHGHTTPLVLNFLLKDKRALTSLIGLYVQLSVFDRVNQK